MRTLVSCRGLQLSGPLGGCPNAEVALSDTRMLCSIMQRQLSLHGNCPYCPTLDTGSPTQAWVSQRHLQTTVITDKAKEARLVNVRGEMSSGDKINDQDPLVWI